MIDRICFSVVLRGQLPVQSEAGTKAEMVSAKASSAFSGNMPLMFTIYLDIVCPSVRHKLFTKQACLITAFCASDL